MSMGSAVTRLRSAGLALYAKAGLSVVGVHFLSLTEVVTA